MQRETPRLDRWTTAALVAVILTAAGAALTLLASRPASSRALDGVSTAFMKEVAARAETATLRQLETGPASLEIVRLLVQTGRLDGTDDSALEPVFRSLLAVNGEIEMLNFGRPNGDFMMVKRMPDGSLSTKWVRRAEGVVESSWRHDNEAWSRDEPFSDRREPAAEAFDPRSRPWYRQAEESGALSWVDPYIYYSDRMPGIACALPLYDAGGAFLGVAGADVGIADLSELLATFRVGSSGAAVILTDKGRLIAYPAFSDGGFEIAQEVAGLDRPELVLRHVEDSSDRVLAAAFARRPATGEGDAESFAFDHGGETYVARFEPFTLAAGRRWIVGVVAPEDELLGASGGGRALPLALTLACALLAAGLLVVLRRG